MIEWGKVPWPLWAYVVLSVMGMVRAGVKASGSMPATGVVISILIILAWDFFLLRGLRWLWIATIVIFALGLAFALANLAGTWYATLSNLACLGLLLLPATRRFFGNREAAVA